MRTIIQEWALVLMNAAGAAFCWWTMISKPKIDFPAWFFIVIPVLAAAAAGLSAVLSNEAWPNFFAASTAGTFAGLWIGSFMLWPSNDGESNSLLVLIIPAITAITAVLAIVAVLMGRRISLSDLKHRRVIWWALIGYCAYGPVVLLLTPLVVALRPAHNDQIAQKRFAALKAAVATTVVQDSKFTDTCDGNVIRGHYSGPRFSSTDWDRIAGRDGVQPKGGVEERGYDYLVSCYPNSAYSITAFPLDKSEGTLALCADQTGKPKCGIEPNEWGNRACKPCS